jgi:transposase
MRVARRFVEEGPAGLVDRREDNGVVRLSADHGGLLLMTASQSPQDYGLDRPTWTQELFTMILAEKTGTVVSTTTISRALARLGVKLKRPNPSFFVPGKRGGERVGSMK